MSGSRNAPPKGARPHLTTEHVGRQLRAAFNPVPTAAEDFAELLRRLDAAESPCEPVAAE